MCPEKVLYGLPRCSLCGRQSTVETISDFIMRDGATYCRACLERKDSQISQKLATKTIEIPKIPKEKPIPKQETYWYPAFRLKVNPFRYFEASLEEEVDYIPYLETIMHRKIRNLIKSGTSSIIEGKRGCGKTSLIYSLKFVEKMKVENPVFSVLTPKSVLDIYSQVYDQVTGEDLELIYDTVKTLWAPIIGKRKAVDGGQERCQLCPNRCHMTFSGGRDTHRGTSYIEEYADNLSGIQIPCKAKEKILIKIFQEYMLADRPFLLDTPDDLSFKELEAFKIFCNLALKSGNTLIIFGTLEQSFMLKETDLFARFPIVKYDLPNLGFFIELFKERIDGLGREYEEKGPYPFKDEIIECLAEYSNYVPREFIQLCNLVLLEMSSRELTEPCDLQFLKTLNLTKPSRLDEEDLIINLLSQHKGEWVGISKLSSELEEKFGSQFTPRKTGALLKKLHFSMRRYDNSGKAEVLITPSLLETIKNNAQKPQETQNPRKMEEKP